MKILIIDDEKNVRRILRDYLTNEGYEIIEGSDGEEGISRLIENPDTNLVLLDIRMPKMNGFETIDEIQKISEAPVIFLTALDETFDEVKGLELGAYDYITKPFSYNVLIARVKSCLKKTNPHTETQIKLGQVILDTDHHYVIVEEKRELLTQKEYELLIYLIKHPGINVERSLLLDRIWGYDYYGDPRTVDTHVKTLRNKLNPCGEMIKTVRGVGYRYDEI